MELNCNGYSPDSPSQGRDEEEEEEQPGGCEEEDRHNANDGQHGGPNSEAEPETLANAAYQTCNGAAPTHAHDLDLALGNQPLVSDDVSQSAPSTWREEEQQSGEPGTGRAQVENVPENQEESLRNG